MQCVRVPRSRKQRFFAAKLPLALLYICVPHVVEKDDAPPIKYGLIEFWRRPKSKTYIALLGATQAGSRHNIKPFLLAAVPYFRIRSTILIDGDWARATRSQIAISLPIQSAAPGPGCTS